MDTNVENEIGELEAAIKASKLEVLDCENEIDAILMEECEKVQERIKTMRSEISKKIDLLTQENKPELVEIYKYIAQVFQMIYDEKQKEARKHSDRIWDHHDQMQSLTWRDALVS